MAGSHPVIREVGSLLHGRLVVEIRGDGVTLRQKGRRTRFALPWGQVYQRAAEVAAQPKRRRIRRSLV